VPYFYAQFLTEFYLRSWGPHGLFVISAVPISVALLLTVSLLLPREQVPSPVIGGGSYFAVLRNVELLRPYSCVFVVGAFFGFASSFLPIMLADAQVLVGWYFAPYALMALASRFFVLRRLQRLPLHLLLAIGTACVGSSGLILGIPPNLTTAALAGLVFGFGYSIVFPTAVECVSRQFSAEERAPSVALVNTSFQLGALLSPIVVSYALGLVRMSTCWTILAVIALTAAGRMRPGTVGPQRNSLTGRT